MASYPYPTFSKPYENYGYEALTVTDTAAGFTAATIKPTSGDRTGIPANAALIYVSNFPITWRCDGTTATAANGMHSLANDVILIEGAGNVARFSAIRTTADSATVYVLYYW